MDVDHNNEKQRGSLIMTEITPRQLVFIDSRVPDLQDLLDGLAPDEQAFVVDSSSDGVQQVADVLASNNFSGISSISIVSHGNTGTLDLGSSVITEANLSAHSNALAEIGASLAPGGIIKLYGCDVAQARPASSSSTIFPLSPAVRRSTPRPTSWVLPRSAAAGPSTPPRMA